MRARLVCCAVLLLTSYAAWGASRRRDGQRAPLIIRVLQGPHTDAQFYSSPELSLHARYSRAEHLRAADWRMTEYSTPWQGVDMQQTRSPAVSLDNGQVGRGIRSQDWLYEFLAWLPFGLLFLALLDRTPAEMARLMGELGADVNSARSAQSVPRSSAPTV